MKSMFGGYTRLEKERVSYFAGANTAFGFRGLYGEIADERELERVYIIKGGAGTGKSTLIKKAVEIAESAGASTESYFCGSDPYSLDCAVIGGKIALLDGTAPHNLDMLYPGASSEIVDVSKFWDSDVLEKRRQDIVKLGTEKSNTWDGAYRYMCAADAVNRERIALAKRIFDYRKARAFVDRFIKRIGRPDKTETGKTETRYTRAVTMRGSFYIPTFEKLANNLYYIADVYCTAPLLTDMLARQITSAGYDITVSYLPITGQVDGIYLPRHDIAVVTAVPQTEHRTVRMSRFVMNDVRREFGGESRLAARIENSCIDEAVSYLKKAAEYHFALEEIYKSAMDFDALEKYSENLFTEISSRLSRQA